MQNKSLIQHIFGKIKRFIIRKTAFNRLHTFSKSNNPYWSFSYQNKDFKLRFFDCNDVIAHSVVTYNNFFEFEYLELMSDFIKKGDVVLDIGANIGNHSLYYADILGAQVHAFEGNPDVFPMLEENVSNSNVKIHKTLLGKEKGYAEISQEHEHNIGGTSFKTADTGFPVRTLDSFVDEIKRIDFIKIDVEGFEALVLQGGGNIIMKNKPLIAVEILPDKYDEVIEILKNMGYELMLKYRSIDYIFSPKSH